MKNQGNQNPINQIKSEMHGNLSMLAKNAAEISQELLEDLSTKILDLSDKDLFAFAKELDYIINTKKEKSKNSLDLNLKREIHLYEKLKRELQSRSKRKLNGIFVSKEDSENMEIFEKLNNLKKGDVIVFKKKGYRVKVAGNKLGKTIFQFEGSPMDVIDGHPQNTKEYTQGELFALPGFTIGDIREIIPAPTSQESSGILSLDIIEKKEIEEKIKNLNIGDAIVYEDGYTLIVVEKKLGKVLIRFEATGSINADGVVQQEQRYTETDLFTNPAFLVSKIIKIKTSKQKLIKVLKTIEIKNREEIEKKTRTLKVGDEIIYKDGFVVVIEQIDGFGQIKVKMQGTPSQSAGGELFGEGKWYTISDFFTLPGLKIDDIREIKTKEVSFKINNPNHKIEDGGENGIEDGGEKLDPIIDPTIDPTIDPIIDPVKPDPIDPVKPDPIDPVKPDPIDPVKPDPIDPIKPEPENISIDTVLSNTFQTHQENARLYAEEYLKDEYEATHKLNLFKRAKFFFSRGKMRKKLINTYMKDIAKNKAFTMDTKSDSELTRAANRHSLEKKTNFGDIEQLTTVALEIPEVNHLAQEFVLGRITEDYFKLVFNTIVEQHPSIKSELKKGNIEYFSTNILEQLKVERGQYGLMDRLSQALMTGADIEAINQEIRQFILDYQTSPKFLNQISPDLEKGDLEKLKKYFQFRESLREQELKNLKIKLHVLDKGKAAYQIDNSKNEKGWLYKLGHKLDKIPWYYQVPAYAGLGVLVGATGGALGMGVVAASALKIGVFAGTTGFMNFVKKWTHYTKEHNTHEKNRVSANQKEKVLVKKRQDDFAKKGALNRAKRYKAKRQLELYNDATHDQFLSTKELAGELLAIGSSLRSLSVVDQGHLSSILLQSKVRLDAYLKTGHNFLYSDSPELVEQEMNLLWKSLELGAQKLGITFDEINNLSTLEGDDYATLVTELESDYENANRRFKKERTWLATKYGVTTAAVSAGFAVASQAIMGNGLFSTKPTENLLQGSGVDQFTLGGHEITGNSEVAAELSSQLSGLHPDATMEVLYSAGTDNVPTKVASILNTSGAYQDKMTAVISNIKSLGLSSTQESAFLREIASKPRESDRAGKAFSNDFLHGYRALETLEKAAEGLASSGNNSMVPHFAYDATRSIAGTHRDSAAERFGQVVFKIKDMIPGVGENTRFVPLPLFFNTFKKKKQEKENQHPDQIEKGDKDLILTKPITDKDQYFGGKREEYGDNPFKDEDHHPISPKPFDKKKKIGVSPRGTVIGGDIDPYMQKEYPRDFKFKTPKEIARFVLNNGVPLYKDPNYPELYKATLQVEVALEKGNRAEAENILARVIERERKNIATLDSLNLVAENALNAVDLAFDQLGGDRSLIPDKEKIHIVGNYEFWGQRGGYNPSSLGFCQYMNGELFINIDALLHKYPLGLENHKAIEDDFAHTVIHEMIHATSTANYWHQYDDASKLDRENKDNQYPNARRMGAQLWRFTKGPDGSIKIKARGRALNEAITEDFSIKIMQDSNRNINFKAYTEERKILDLLIKQYKIPRENFYKLLVNRKYSLRNINERLAKKTIDGKEIQTPRFYTLLMSIMDYEFDQNSGYQLTEALILGKSLTITPEMKSYFHPGLLDTNGLIKQEMLEAYPNLSDAEAPAMAA